MIGKFATVIALMLVAAVLLVGQGFSQDTPAGQTPTAPPAAATPTTQQPAATPTAQKPDSGQEPADEVSTSRRKRPHDYKNWSYNVGAGANVDSGSTRTFVRAGGIDATAGVARNANKYLGLRADFIFANLPLRASTLQLAGATGATSYILGLTLDPIINFSVTKEFSAYVLLGPGFYHRSGELDSDTTVPGSACNAFWNWWGACSGASVPLSGSFVHAHQNELGYNAGVGVARKMPSGVEIYAEFRLMHGNHDNIQTDVRPITIGVRW